MRLIDEAILRELRGKHLLLVFDKAGTRALEVNESFAFLWNKVVGTDFSADDLVSALCEEYGLKPEQAREDVLNTISIWEEKHLLKADETL